MTRHVSGETMILVQDLDGLGDLARDPSSSQYCSLYHFSRKPGTQEHKITKKIKT